MVISEWAAAEEAYQKVLEIEPRHATALASLGMIFHMREEYTDAIQKYHEVRGDGCLRRRSGFTSNFGAQTVSYRLSVSNR
jgi:hypothetical protein